MLYLYVGRVIDGRKTLKKLKAGSTAKLKLNFKDVTIFYKMSIEIR